MIERRRGAARQRGRRRVLRQVQWGLPAWPEAEPEEPAAAEEEGDEYDLMSASSRD